MNELNFVYILMSSRQTTLIDFIMNVSNCSKLGFAGSINYTKTKKEKTKSAFPVVAFHVKFKCFPLY